MSEQVGVSLPGPIVTRSMWVNLLPVSGSLISLLREDRKASPAWGYRWPGCGRCLAAPGSCVEPKSIQPWDWCQLRPGDLQAPQPQHTSALCPPLHVSALGDSVEEMEVEGRAWPEPLLGGCPHTCLRCLLPFPWTVPAWAWPPSSTWPRVPLQRLCLQVAGRHCSLQHLAGTSVRQRKRGQCSAGHRVDSSIDCLKPL